MFYRRCEILTIQIDDAGWGNPVGGVIIGAIRVETGDFYHSLIEVSYFQNPKFKRKEYLEKAAQISLELIGKLKFHGNEEIEICPGYIHQKTKERFNERGISFVESKIEGILQEKVELAFEQHQKMLGCNSRGFNQEKQWLREDYKIRKTFGKHGWKKWEKHFGDLEGTPYRWF